LHEFYAGAGADGASLSALALLLAGVEGRRTRLWVRHEAQDREMGAPCPEGLSELGLDPSRLMLMRARDVPSALQAGLEGARCAALGAVILEIAGAARAYDLTASRRLSLAAKTSGVPLFLLRVGAEPLPSAAETRWLLRAAPSRALLAQAPGPPAFHLTLLRARSGQEGERHFLEWNRDAQRLEIRLSGTGFPGPADPDREPASGTASPLSRAVVPFSADRPDASHGPSVPLRRAG
jgi:protein ImuA